MCPTCNVPMVDGACPQCGAKAEATPEAAPAPESTESTPAPETTPEA